MKNRPEFKRPNSVPASIYHVPDVSRMRKMELQTGNDVIKAEVIQEEMVVEFDPENVD